MKVVEINAYGTDGVAITYRVICESVAEIANVKAFLVFDI